MEIKFVDNHKNTTYSEEPQSNLLRWQIYKQITPTEYHSVTGKFKCKDFFNDFIVAYRAKYPFVKYGFQSDPNLVNPDDPDGIPVVLTNIVKNFKKNLSIANKWLVEQGFPKLSPEFFSPKECLMYIPWEYTKNTYYISAVSLLIRLCNNSKYTLKERFEELWDWEELDGRERDLAGVLLHKRMDKLGELAKYLWYYNPKNCFPSDHMETSNYSFSSLTHNCGIKSWNIGV